MSQCIEDVVRQVLTCESTGHCFRCNKLTHDIDMNFEVHLCPTCFDSAWDEFFAALQNGEVVNESHVMTTFGIDADDRCDYEDDSTESVSQLSPCDEYPPSVMIP